MINQIIGSLMVYFSIVLMIYSVGGFVEKSWCNKELIKYSFLAPLIFGLVMFGIGTGFGLIARG